MASLAPRSGVRFTSGSTTLLTYAVALDPSPWVTATSDQTVGTSVLRLVITNLGDKAVDIQEIDLSFPVGKPPSPGPSLLPSITNILASTSNSGVWSFSGAASNFVATYTLSPKTTDPRPRLEPGESFAAELSQILTWSRPGTAPVTITEITGQDGRTGDTSFEITTFPASFFLENVAAVVFPASEPVPVAEVASGSKVTLIWNSSVPAAGIRILMSTRDGQRTFTPDESGKWLSKEPLYVDTVFTVVATADVDNVQFQTSQSVAVAVSRPELVAATVTADAVTAKAATITDGNQTTAIAPGGITASTIAAGAVTASQLTASDGAGNTTTIAPGTITTGTVTAGPATFTDSDGSVAISGGAVSAQNTLSGSSVSVTWGSDNATFNASWIGANNGLGLPAITGATSFSVMQQHSIQGPSGMSIEAPTDGFAIGTITPQGSVDGESFGTLTISIPGITASALGTNISPTDTNDNVVMPGYVIVPVPQGTTVTWSWTGTSSGSGKPPAIAAWFMALGSAPVGPVIPPKPFPPFPPPEAAPAAPPPPAPSVPTVEERAAAIVELLAPRLREPPSAEERQALIAALAGLARG